MGPWSGNAETSGAHAGPVQYDGLMVRRNIPSAGLAEFCRRNRIHRLSLFGSMLRGEDRPDSDIDLLVEFHPGQEPTFFGLAAMERELSTLFGGRRVDLRTPEDLSRYFREAVLATAEVQYVG
jgi:predicted nucleotidyltransferase